MASRAQRSGPSYGAPMSTPKPGQSTRQRPKPGDKAPKPKPKPKKRPVPDKAEVAPPKKRPGDEGSVYRDWRGIEGVLEDAEKGKKK